MVKMLIDHRDQGVAALAACVEGLRREVPAGTPILCLGYSAGGMVALDYGRSGADVSGIILCSALLMTAAEGMDTRIRPPVLILQGTQDQVSQMETIAAVITEMMCASNSIPRRTMHSIIRRLAMIPMPGSPIRRFQRDGQRPRSHRS
jgi:predicted esterase